MYESRWLVKSSCRLLPPTKVLHQIDGCLCSIQSNTPWSPSDGKAAAGLGDREGDEGPLVSRVAMAGRGREVAVSDPSGERGSMATT